MARTVDHIEDHPPILDGLHQLSAASRGLHQGYRCVAGRVCRLRVLRPHGIRPRQLRPQVSVKPFYPYLGWLARPRL